LKDTLDNKLKWKEFKIESISAFEVKNIIVKLDAKE
jgi:hypothetical protein